MANDCECDAMLCPKHPEHSMTETVRHFNGMPIMQCDVCVAAIRAKLAIVLALPNRCFNPRRKQIVLPPVMMSERWP